MPKRTWSQRILVYLITGCAITWFAISIAEPFVEYRLGKGPFTVLLSRLSSVAIAGIFIAAGVSLILRWSGVLPRPEPSLQSTRLEWNFSWRFMLVTLGFWILVSFALVALFVVLPYWIPDQHLLNALTNVLPMTLLVAVWIGLLVSMRWRVRGDGKSDPTSPPTA